MYSYFVKTYIKGAATKCSRNLPALTMGECRKHAYGAEAA